MRFHVALPTATRIGVGMLRPKGTHLLNYRLEIVPSTIVVVPVTPGRPLDRTRATDGTTESMQSQIEMATKWFVQH